jgi:PAS domain S-box-containing protein
MNVLIVDDNADDRRLLRYSLAKHGCEQVIEARDGQEGLEMAKVHRPDLIISDALMPRMDGFEFLHLIKMDEELRAIPFVFHSSVYTGLKDEELASNLGAEAFITKPKEPEEFWGELAAILERVATGAKKPPPSEPMGEEAEYLRKYSGIVAAKLEEKVRDLEESLARRKEAEEELRKSEQFLNNIIENSPDMIFVKDARELRFIRFNKAGEELLGYSREELVGKNDYDVFAPHEAEFFTGKDREVISNGRLVDIPEETIRTKGKGTRVLHTKKIPIPDEAGNPKYLLGISEDITEHKKAEETLVKLSLAVEQSPAAIMITDTNGNIEFVNPKFVQITGYSPEEVMGRNPRILKSGETPPEEYRKLWASITSGMEWHGVFHNRKKDGELFWEAATISPIRNRNGVTTNFIAIKEDINERKNLEEQLRQSQKMEAIGLLAGGLAHDFNNILTAIIGFSSLIRMKLARDDPLQVNVGHVLAAADRAANLTQSLLTFSRKQVMAAKTVDLNEIVLHVEKFLKRIIGEDVELRIVPLAEDLWVFVDIGQIEQVLMNLATNARDAMPGGGALVIETTSMEMDDAYVKAYGYGKAGSYALVTMTDNGRGMDQETKKRIFEPFFTTKEIGKGTGLGLSVVYGIVKQHKGFINAYSEPGLGTTFSIYLPLVKKVEIVEERGVTLPPKGGTETILLAEDDEVVRTLAVNILEEAGYTVVVAENGDEAVTRFSDHRDEIQLLLFDLIMPKKNGKEAWEEIRKLCPAIRAIFLSGYTADILGQKGLLEQGMDVINKPFSPHDILRRIRAVLDR